MKTRTVSSIKAITICAALPVLLWAFASGPDPRKTGAPGDSTCAECHTGTAVNGGPGRVTINFPGGNTYMPGTPQRITVRVEDPNMRRWGFQLSARLASNERNGQAGSLRSVDATTQVICEDGSPKGASGCRAAAPLEFVEHTMAGTRMGTTGGVNFEFEWTPPAAGAGNVVLYAAGNAANGDGTNGGDRIYTTSITLTPQAGGPPRPAISSGGVVNGASFLPVISPKAWFTVRGENLGESFTAEFRDGAYPTEINGVQVLVNNRPAPLYFSNGTQINALVPDDTAEGPVPVVVVRGGQRSDAAMVEMARHSPAFFPWPQNQVVATDPSFAFKARPGTFGSSATTTPARPGDVIILWGTGFGATEPNVAAGSRVPGDRQHNIVNTPTVRIGGVTAEYIGGALAPGFAGLYQLAVRVPAELQNGDHAVVAQVGGLSSPSNLTLAVQR